MFKITCIKDQTNGFEGGWLGIGKEESKKIDGLTKGKTYLAQALTITEGSGMDVLQVSTKIVFFIFNDDEKWQTYDVDLFKLE